MIWLGGGGITDSGYKSAYDDTIRSREDWVDNKGNESEKPSDDGIEQRVGPTRRVVLLVIGDGNGATDH